MVDFLDSAEALCKVDNMSLSKNMAVDILACMVSTIYCYFKIF